VLTFLKQLFRPRTSQTPIFGAAPDERSGPLGKGATVYNTDAGAGSGPRLPPVRQVIGGIVQETPDVIDQMKPRKHDLEFQYDLCKEMMTEGSFLPYPFGRAVILLRKAKRYDEEVAVCEYALRWSDAAEKRQMAEGGDGWGVWESPRVLDIRKRLPRARALAAEAQRLKCDAEIRGSGKRHYHSQS
jgi:hypothetical protein